MFEKLRLDKEHWKGIGWREYKIKGIAVFVCFGFIFEWEVFPPVCKIEYTQLCPQFSSTCHQIASFKLSFIVLIYFVKTNTLF